MNKTTSSTILAENFRKESRVAISELAKRLYAKYHNDQLPWEGNIDADTDVAFSLELDNPVSFLTSVEHFGNVVWEEDSITKIHFDVDNEWFETADNSEMEYTDLSLDDLHNLHVALEKAMFDNVPDSHQFVFTVNDSGKKVVFSPGNLFWDGSKFGFEKHQYDFPTSWNENHVGHFYWTKDAAKAVAPKYNDQKRRETDKFFAADGRAIQGYTVLSRVEWLYLFAHAMAKNSSGTNTITITGKSCLVLKPDEFTGTVKDSYTAKEWTIAEKSGLVALPFVGYRYGTSFFYVGPYGYYWSASPYKSYGARGAYFRSDAAYLDFDDRSDGYSVRLVKVL